MFVKCTKSLLLWHLLWKVEKFWISVLVLDMASIESLVALRIGEEREFKKSNFCLCILKCVLKVESVV